MSYVHYLLAQPSDADEEYDECELERLGPNHRNHAAIYVYDLRGHIIQGFDATRSRLIRIVYKVDARECMCTKCTNRYEPNAPRTVLMIKRIV